MKTKKAIDLINRLEADKEALISGQETLQKALAEKNAEIERLKAEINSIDNFEGAVLTVDGAKGYFPWKFIIKAIETHMNVENIKSEAIKEFAERLKPIVEDGYVVDIIDNLVKEMVGDAE